MTKRKAERLIGHETLSVGANDGKVAYGAFRGDQLATLAEHTTEDLALQALVRGIYRLNSLEVLNSTAGAARVAEALGASKSTTAAFDPTAAHTRSLISSPFVGLS